MELKKALSLTPGKGQPQAAYQLEKPETSVIDFIQHLALMHSRNLCFQSTNFSHFFVFLSTHTKHHVTIHKPRKDVVDKAMFQIFYMTIYVRDIKALFGHLCL